MVLERKISAQHIDEALSAGIGMSLEHEAEALRGAERHNQQHHPVRKRAARTRHCDKVSKDQDLGVPDRCDSSEVQDEGSGDDEQKTPRRAVLQTDTWVRWQVL